jgi:integrase
MFLTKRGKIWYVHYIHPLTGKRNVKSTKAHHKSDALIFLTEFKEKIKPKPRQITLSVLKEEVIKHVKFHVRKATVEKYVLAFKHMEHLWGNMLIKFITSDHIEKYKIYRLGMGLSKATVNIDYRSIRAIFNLAIQWGYIEKNPCKGVKQYQLDEKERLAFTENEIKLILDTIDNVKIKHLTLIALFTGCRVEELLNLQWSDINFIEKIITIRNKDTFVTKTGKMRYIPISNNLMEILNSIKPENTESCSDHFVIGKFYNVKISRNYVAKVFKAHLRKLGFPERYHFHCLRHTFITQLARKGVNVYDIKQLAGHSCIQTTELYMHSITDDLRKAVDLLNIGV